MPWALPFDDVGRMHGGAMLLLIGSTPADAEADPPVTYVAGMPICVTKVGQAVDPTKVKAKDSCDWNATDKKAYGTVTTISVDTKITVEGYFYFSKTPGQIISKLYSGGDNVFLEFFPDRVNRLWSGYFSLGAYSDDFDTEATDLVKFTVEAECVGVPIRGADIAVPA